MRLVILMAALAASAGALQRDSEAVVRDLLRDIPETELTEADLARSADEIDETLKDRDDAILRSGGDPRQCHEACFTTARALDAICERHVLPNASLSRAVCYERVDAGRIACIEQCDD